MCMSKAVDLIQHQQSEYEQRGRERPQLFANQTPSYENLCGTVDNQIGAGKVLRIER